MVLLNFCCEFIGNGLEVSARTSFQQPRQLFSVFIGTWPSVNLHRDSNTNSADFQVHHFSPLLPFLEILYVCSSEAGHHSLFSKLSHSLYHTVLILVSFDKSYRWSPCSLTSTIHSSVSCREQKSSSTGIGCVDTSLLRGTDPSPCCTDLTRMTNDGQPGSNTVFFHRSESKDGG